MLRLVSILIAAVLLAGPAAAQTASPTVRTILLPSDATPHERGRMLQAVNEWNAALAGSVVIEEARAGARADWRVEFALGGLSGAAPPHVPSASTMDAFHVQQPRGCVAADALPGAGRIRIFVHCLPPANLTGKMIHEIGHLLGLGHRPGTAMDETCCFYAQRVDAWSAAEAKRLQAGRP